MWQRLQERTVWQLMNFYRTLNYIRAGFLFTSLKSRNVRTDSIQQAFFGKPDENTQIYDSNTYVKEYTYLGIVGECNDKGLYHIEQRNKFSVGETIEVMRPDGTNLEVTVKAIYNEDGEAMESAPHPKQQLYIDLGVPLCQYDILRRKED